MEVTLKKATQLAAALLKATKAPEPTAKISRHSVQPVEQLLVQGTADYGHAMMLHLDDLRAVYTIRALVGGLNTSEVSPLLTVRAGLDAQISALTVVEAEREDSRDLEALERKRASLATATNLYGDEDLLVTVATEEFVKPLVSAAKRQRVQVQDQLDALNYTRRLELPTEVVDALRRHDLV